MLYPETLNVNEHGHLTIGGCDTVELANRYGTPLYVMDENVIRKACGITKSIDENYQNGGMVAYASKACCFKEICRIVTGGLRY